ncbi:MAG: SRPBCC family protein [Acidimicrobiia bacterium]|nr:SRPBCC family protein [Acidimicrobiia bacterium]MDH4306377.1 SRPBCC family protein [Acidimicrobiia bacterium]MDH5294332.1 SRPBCC family protein [Acidimicrobiia bacterium]
MRYEHSIEINAPAETVWDLTLDVEGLPELTPTVTRAQRLDSGPMRVGSQARLKQPAQSERVWTVTVCDAPSHFEWTSKMGPMSFVGGHHIEATPSGCRNTLRIDLTGPGSGLFGRLIGSQIRKAIATENAGFKRVAEARISH